ncbi:MAG: N-acetylglucosamine-6-phosphate deacetylase [Xanthobacteraceae bacterium]
MSPPTPHAIAADHVFDGAVVHRNAAVIIDGAGIVALAPRTEAPATMPVRVLPDGAWIAPGFIDVQVNGGGDVLFNDMPTVEGIRTIAAAHRKFGTTALLPTLITDTPEKMRTAIAAVQELVDADPGILGIHLEGPFISPERPGVHEQRYIRVPTAEDGAMLAAPRRGATVVTLAPERVPQGFIRQLTRAGVRVCLGHSLATYAETRAAMAEGLTGFTHLFNAMRPMASREPGPIAAALESADAWFGMIVDGAHVDPAMLRLALRGAAKPMLVTDAMPPVGGSRTTFALYGGRITVRDGRCVRDDGVLAGSALNMAAAVRNCVRLLGVPLEDALRFASTHPAGFLGLDRRLGRLAPGCRADLVAFDPTNIEVLDTWTAGETAITA